MRIGVRVTQFVRQLLRTTLYEARRTKRIVVASGTRPRTENPIFIIGVHRSGTTLVRLILDSHSRIACPPESFFLLSVQHFLGNEKTTEGLRAMGFPREQVVERIREFTSQFFEEYVASRGKSRWADKTPAYINCLDLIDTLYGSSARYVLIFRHGLDSACSIAQIPDIEEAEPHISACEGDRYAGAARYWAAQCRKLLKFQREHPAQCLSVFYEKLVQAPEEQARRLLDFLDEPWESDVLLFHKHPHDTWGGLEDIKALRSRGFEPNIGSYRTQPSEVIARMLEQAAPVLDELGYDVRAFPEEDSSREP